MDRNVCDANVGTIKLVHKKKGFEHIIVGEIFNMFTPHILSMIDKCVQRDK